MHCEQKRQQTNNFLNKIDKTNMLCKVVLLQNDMGLPYKPLEDG